VNPSITHGKKLELSAATGFRVGPLYGIHAIAALAHPCASESPGMDFIRHIRVAHPTGSLWLCKSAMTHHIPVVRPKAS
jgi:hypothetical protein